MLRIWINMGVLSTLLFTLPVFAAAPPVDMGQALGLQLEKEYLQGNAAPLDAVKGVAYEFLRQKKLQKLREIAADVRVQRQATQDFEGFFRWMSYNLAGYDRYIQATSYVASAAKLLPVPYAGQASNFTKFAGQFTVALNKASVSTTQYLQASQRFLAMVDAIDPAKPLNDKVLAEAQLFADRTLLAEMENTKKNLSNVSDLSAGALSFLTGLNQFVGDTAAYWNKVKGFVKKDADPKEKNFLADSVQVLKTQAERFHGRFTVFDEKGQRETAGVKSLVVYDELAATIAAMN